jgi:hypothetical protein
VIFWGGLIAGALDITYDLVFFGLRIGPDRYSVLELVATSLRDLALRLANRWNPVTLQSVAHALNDVDYSTGGLASAALWLFFHFVIAFTAAAVYYAASRKFAFLVSHAVACGMIYGVVIYALKNSVVAPRSVVVVVSGLLVHMFFIGLPIALFARRYSR